MRSHSDGKRIKLFVFFLRGPQELGVSRVIERSAAGEHDLPPPCAPGGPWQPWQVSARPEAGGTAHALGWARGVSGQLLSQALAVPTPSWPTAAHDTPGTAAAPCSGAACAGWQCRLTTGPGGARGAQGPVPHPTRWPRGSPDLPLDAAPCGLHGSCAGGCPGRWVFAFASTAASEPSEGPSGLP